MRFRHLDLAKVCKFCHGLNPVQLNSFDSREIPKLALELIRDPQSYKKKKTLSPEKLQTPRTTPLRPQKS